MIQTLFQHWFLFGLVSVISSFLSILSFCLIKVGHDADYTCKDLFIEDVLTDRDNQYKSYENQLEHKDHVITKIANESADKDATIEYQKQELESRNRLLEAKIPEMKITGKSMYADMYEVGA